MRLFTVSNGLFLTSNNIRYAAFQAHLPNFPNLSSKYAGGVSFNYFWKHRKDWKES